MDLADLALFIDVARSGGFAPVARARNLDPSFVSRAIAALERELGCRLFQRTTRRLSLTEAGAEYLARIAPLAAEIDAAGEAARATTIGGRLRLTASIAYGTERLVPLLPAFRAEFPLLRLDLMLTDANVDLVADHLDLAIRLGPSVPPGLIGVPLHPTRYGLYVSPAYRAAAPPLARPEDLAGHRCLLFAGALQRLEWRFLGADGRESRVAVDGDIAITSPLALREAMRAGLGPGLLPDWFVAADIAAGRLVDALPGHQASTTAFGSSAWLLYPSRALLPAKVRAAIDFLRRHLGAAA